MTAGGPHPGRRRALLAVHLALAGLIAIAAGLAVLAPTSDDGLSLAPLALGELILLGIGGAVVGLFDRFGPLLLVDVLVAAPLVGVLSTSAADGRTWAVAATLVPTALVAAVLAAREVRRRPIERIGIGLALVALAVSLGNAPMVAAVPVLVLVALAAPEGVAAWIGGRARATGTPGSTAAGPRPVRRPSGAPDPAAVLGPRIGQTAVLHSAPHGEDREE